MTIPEAEQDKQLARKIIDSELSGVFNWVLAGLRRLLEQGRFTESQAVYEQLESYKKHSDTVQIFLDDQGYRPSADHYTALKDLYREYRAYCIDGGYRAVNNRNFQKRLNAVSVQTARTKLGFVAYVGRAE